MNLKQIVPLGFGSIFILTVIGTAASQFNIITLNKAREAINQAYLVRLELQELEKNLVDAETGQRGFLLTNNPTFLEPYTLSLGESGSKRKCDGDWSN
ncbi:MAG: CHASE3 domain-containing protein [Spirulinaceae cyanobacterium]